MRHGVPTPALPLELVIAIIDLLSDDKESLDSCSLVSSQLLSPSRHRLFAHVCVSATEPEWNHEAFAHFLTSTRVIGHHIRSLELDGADDDGETPTFLTSLTLSTILYNLPNLRDLTFSIIEVQQGYLSPHPYPPLTSIRSLCFESAVFETDLRNLFVFLSSFPELRKLDFRELAFIPGDLPNVDGPETHTPALRTVQDLTLGGYTDRDWYPNLLRWCRLRVSLTSITSLDLCLLEAGYAAEMGCMLQEARSNLQSLRLRLSVRFMENSRKFLLFVTLSYHLTLLPKKIL